MSSEIEFLQRLRKELHRVALAEAARGRSTSVALLRHRSIRVLAATAALVLAVTTFMLWTTIRASDRTGREPGIPGVGPAAPGAEANPAGTRMGQELWAVNGDSPDDAWAVGGSYEAGKDGATSLILHWDGNAWTRVPSPDVGSVADVDAASEDDAWAVGRDDILHWDGTAWAISPHSGPPGTNFAAIDASRPNDVWAIGIRYGAQWVDKYGERNIGYDTLTFHLDGNHWKVVPSPNPTRRDNQLVSVLALSPTDVWAVGYSQDDSDSPRTMTLHWDGSTWSIVPSPDPGNELNVLWGVGTDGGGGVWAIGHYRDRGSSLMGLYLRWTNGAWQMLPGPPGKALNLTPTALSGTSADDVWAAGSEPTSSLLIAHWDGTVWLQQNAESPGLNPTLADVVALSATDVWAVGRYQGPVEEEGAAQVFALIEHWDGASWNVIKVSPTRPG